MKSLFNLFCCCLLALLVSCGEDNAPSFQLPPGIYTIAKVYDVGNSGNSKDIRVELTVSTEFTSSDLIDVRLVLAKNASTFTVDKISGLIAENYFPIPISNVSKQIIKPSSMKDTDGDAIVNDVTYTVYVALLGKQETRQLSSSKELTLRNKSIYAGDYVGEWEDLGPPGPAKFPVSFRLDDNNEGTFFFSENFKSFSTGLQDMLIKMKVDGASITAFEMNQFMIGYAGSTPGVAQVSNCPATQTATGRFEDDVHLVLATFNWADCDGTRDVQLKFKRQ
jgi:hypothetical protein